MCGIVGIFHLREKYDVDKKLLSFMNQSQLHRGPDEGGLHFEPGIGLGHRRLSILDLSNGQQPLFNEDGSIAVIYNGEIYNFREIATELKKSGYTFHTNCDTEVIVHAWDKWGDACVERFRGMFAFAVWDRNQNKLFLARDRLGIKPLYYAELDDGQFIFASELKALLVHPGLKRELDSFAIEEYFTFGYVPEPRSIFKQVKKLQSGHTLTLNFSQKVPASKMYWDISFKTIDAVDEQEIQEELIARLKEAIDIRMMADVPLGAFLSGGVDSSAIVALMNDLSNGDTPLNTCSIGFNDPAYNETDYAEKIAGQYKTNHHASIVESDDFDLLDKLADIYDEPYADSSAMPTYRVCELARKHVTVALSGDGGDELFAGYRRHRFHMNEERVRQIIPSSLRSPVFGVLGKTYPKLDWAPQVFRGKSTFQSLARDSIAAYLNTVSIVNENLRSQLYSLSFKSNLQGYKGDSVFRDIAEKSPTDHPLSLVQYLDMKTWLPGDILTKVDRASMAHSLEVRVPILDHKFVDWASGIPPELKLKGGEGKSVFKKSLESYLPDDILYRKKMGFSIPLSNWFRGPLQERVKDVLLGDSIRETGIFSDKTLKKITGAHFSGAKDYSAVIWSLLMFDSFYKKTFQNVKKPAINYES